jgi:acetyl-CoA C-acetyltransferase
MDPPRIPVIVGVGQINDRPNEDQPGLNSLELMAAALRAADADAGGGWLSRVEALDVVAQISFAELGDVSKPLAEIIGAAPRHCAQTRYPMGDSPVALLNEAALRITAGEATVVAVAGGEALRTAARRAASGRRDALREVSERAARAGRARYGIVAPADVYPLFENAARAAWGQSLAEAQAESACIWADFSQVAARNEGAWIREPVSAEDVLRVTPNNRLIAFPYTKLMVANVSVNQGAGFIVASLAAARAAGLPEGRLVYVAHGAAAHGRGDVLARDRFDYSPSQQATLKQALARNALTTDDLDFVELYSCFPCVPKMARRVIGWPLEKPMSVFGGLTFGGGPVGNYMSHAIAVMVATLRREGRHGLLFGNGGFETTSHALVLSRDPAICALERYEVSVQDEVDAARGPSPTLLETYSGEGIVETYTVFFNREGAPTFAAIVALTPAGERFLARVEAADEDAIRFLTDGKQEPVGARGQAQTEADGLVRWRFA